MHPDDRPFWSDFSTEEALDWCRVLIRNSPEPQASWLKGQMWGAIESGKPVGVRGWETTATLAREDGFTPVLYESLFTSLRAIDVRTFRSHPHRRQVTHPKALPGTPYESGLWQRWPSLVLEEGFEPQAATSLCLLFGETYFPRKG
ncbi:hypothetical protein [Brevibacterium casei]|uniref:hypothetical protein n=1 Tax=Brevibacterium casei TaxID=33889 RepID=UPI00103CDB21|nr:hypothetical protein [Brevibacterium casei]MCT2181420.1 hypothetical protein [Brevibacterium casei]NNV08757.1 hypothetical protein [Geobacillus sp. MMMUD3]QZE26017.1 hypothetical protein K4X33_01520 [Brevibacterium casei]